MVLVLAIVAVNAAIFLVLRSGNDSGETTELATSQTKPIDTAQILGQEGNPVEAAPVEAASVEGNPVEAAPVEAAPVEAAPVEAIRPIPTPPAPTKNTTKAEKPGATSVRASTKRRVPEAKPQPKPKPEPLPMPETPAVGKVSIFTSPSGATVALDGVFVGKSPMQNVEVAPGRHSIALSLTGFEPKVVPVRVVAGRTEKISEGLTKVSVADTTQPKPSDPDLVVAKRLPRTPRVSASKEGSASAGKSILAGTCNGCHAKNGASRVGPRRFTSSQWDRFFSRGSHDRYRRIGGAMSSGQLAHVKTYLKSKAADSARNQGAGIR